MVDVVLIPYSFSGNDIGAEGACYFADALEVNHTLTNLMYFRLIFDTAQILARSLNWTKIWDN